MSVSILIPYILVFKDDDEESRGGSSSRSGSDSGSESGADSRKKHKKKKRNKRRHDEEIDEIDEEDLALMEENLGIKIKKQRRRIRMDSDDDEPEETGTEDGSRRGRLEGNDDLPDIQVNIYSTIFVIVIAKCKFKLPTRLQPFMLLFYISKTFRAAKV